LKRQVPDKVPEDPSQNTQACFLKREAPDTIKALETFKNGKSGSLLFIEI
jgi:hypothetical protein